MKLLFMIGNAAVGKMTVGQELAKLTGLRLVGEENFLEELLTNLSSSARIFL